MHDQQNYFWYYRPSIIDTSTLMTLILWKKLEKNANIYAEHSELLEVNGRFVRT